MKCTRCEEYTGDGSRERLEALIDEAHTDIHEVLGIEPHYAIPDNELFNLRYYLNVRNFRRTHVTEIVATNVPPRLLFFQGNRRIWELNHLTWAHPQNRHIVRITNARGAYLYDSGSILLHKPYWCRQTLIHELLHSTSLFSIINRNYNNQRGRWTWETQRPLREGITETLTGYILNKKYGDCYERWRTNFYDECSVSEERNVKLWCSLCQIIGIDDVATLYLTENDNLADPWNNFIGRVNDQGYGDFNYDLNENINFNVNRFHQICVDSIPNFVDIYDSLQGCLDFYNIT